MMTNKISEQRLDALIGAGEELLDDEPTPAKITPITNPAPKPGTPDDLIARVVTLKAQVKALFEYPQVTAYLDLLNALKDAEEDLKATMRLTGVLELEHGNVKAKMVPAYKTVWDGNKLRRDFPWLIDAGAVGYSVDADKLKALIKSKTLVFKESEYSTREQLTARITISEAKPQ